MTQNSALIPAAQYVRASTERQQYSIEYQSRVISKYAAQHGFEIVRTFSDEARSGLDLRCRPSLRQLLAEVMSGKAGFGSILVFDVSRWGRFQDTDEAAHYEYVCKSAGIPIHYCAEQFSNVGGISDSLLKTLKRFMAGEFSRDLSERASGGLNNIVQRGYKYGSVPGYGLRRALIGRDGNYKQLLAPGELKNISSDRVVLVPGPPEEQAVVQEIYQKFVDERHTVRQITRDLNTRHVPWTTGSRWTVDVVNRILQHPKYVGTLVFNRTEKKLHTPQRRTSSAKWIVVPNAFEGIVDQSLFAAAQQRFARCPRHKSDAQMIDDLKKLFVKMGKLTLPLMRRTELRGALGIACATTYFKRFGSLSRIYQLAGIEPSQTCRERGRTNAQRRQLMQSLADRYPEDIRLAPGRDKYLLFRNSTKIVTRICRSFKIKNGERRWMMGGCDGTSMVLAANLNEQNSDVESLLLLPPIPAESRYWLAQDSPILKSGIRVDQTAFVDSVTKFLELLPRRDQ